MLEANKISEQVSDGIFALIRPNAAGIDIGSSSHYVCVPSHKVGSDKSVRCFGSFTSDLSSLADWLVSLGIETVAMESTGVYWMSLYEVLESRGIEVNLVNARHLKNVDGRKSDVKDSSWIQQLHSVGLLGSSFVPEERVRTLRFYVRHRNRCQENKSKHLQYIGKALQLMNIKLGNILSSLETDAKRKR